ncbi:MAG: restriction endonuclease subunit R, partial [Deltaproteobacteria bacterium]|nr:restriction endonuclease subunit R [Deltaproteobacteria bacterium]
NIYGIKADYLNKFLDAIRKEEVEFETIEIPIKPQHEDKWNSLYTLSKTTKRFEEEEVLKLYIDNKIDCNINLLPKVSLYQSEEEKRSDIEVKEIRAENEGIRFPENVLELLDWERIWQEIIEFKKQRSYWNLIFTKDDIKNILLSDRYKILALGGIFDIRDKKDVQRIEDISLLVIKKYLDLFYHKNAKRFETENLRYEKFKQIPLPFISENKPGYIVQVDKKEKELVKKIRELARDLKKLLKEETEPLPRIYFDNSLYVPLLIQGKKINKISPAGLVESEKKFLVELKNYLKANKNKLNNFEIYLLRNYPFSGIGFQLQWAKFYPDFIMWIKEEKRQIIVFIDPKGLVHTKGLDDEKILFASKNNNAFNIKKIEEELNKKGRINGTTITLESFILSFTPHDKLNKGLRNPPSKEEYINNHVLFLDDSDWPEKMFKSLKIIS